MKTNVEVFFVKIAGEQAVYRRQIHDISGSSEDPNRQVEQEIVRLGVSREEMKRRVISHSTSWRFREPACIILTYLVYSDWFDFGTQSERIERTGPTPRNNGHQRPEDVLVHGIKHFAWLVESDREFTADKELKAGTIEKLGKLFGEPAGRV